MNRSWLAAALIFLASCANQKPSETKKPGPPPAVPVTLAAAVQKAVPVELRAIGNVQAFSTVAVKAQVGGELTSVAFEEGQDVNHGDVLFTIDHRPFEVALK